MKKETVSVTCYGKKEEWTSRAEAVAFYKEAMAGCDPDSSEHQRYTNIYVQLMFGKTDCSDEPRTK